MAEPLVLLNGIAGDEQTWADVIAALGDLAMPLPLVADGPSIEAMAADVMARAPPRFALAGHSMGGYVALAVAAAAPGRVSRLALINSSAAADRPDQTKRREALMARVAAKGYPAVADAMAPMLVHPATLADPARFGPIKEMIVRAGAVRFLREQRATLARPDRRAWLASTDFDVLAVGSRADGIVAAEDSAEIARLSRGARLVMLERSGHVSPMEEPGAVADALRRWLGRGAGQAR